MVNKKNPLIFIVILAMALLIIAYINIQKQEQPTFTYTENTQSSPPEAKTTPEPDSLVNQLALETVVDAKPLKNASTLSIFDEMIDAWRANLAASNHPEDQFLAFLFSKDNESRELFLLQAYGLDPNDVLINKAVMRYCRKQPDSSLCDLPYLSFLEQEEADNVQFHIERAAYAFEDGNIEEAMTLLQGGVASKRSDLHTWRYTEIIEASLNRFGIPRGLRSHGSVMGMAHAIASPGYTNQLRKGLCSHEAMQNSHQTNVRCKEIYNNILESETDIVLIAIATVGDKLASGMSLQDAQSEWQSIYKETYLPIRDKTMSTFNQLILQTANAEGIDLSNPDLTQGKFDHIDIPISDVVWYEFIEKHKSQGLDQANIWLMETLLVEDIVHYENE